MLFRIIQKTSLLTLYLFAVSLIFNSCSPVMVRHQPGPPQHAKAYGYHKKNIYYYYPDTEVYWDCYLKTYTLQKNGIWIVTSTRPEILTKSSSYVVIETVSQQPWLIHSQYKKTYLQSNGKKIGKNNTKK